MDTIDVKKIILLILLIFAMQKGYSQFSTIVDIGSVNDAKIKAKMDLNSGKLLTEINNAFIKGTVPSLTGIEMTDEAKSAVLSLWETSPFRCKETEIIDDILRLQSGKMELRNINLYIKEADSLERNQEGVILFTKTGIIENFYLTIEKAQWKKVMEEGNGVTDLRRREIILNIVENFRTAYNRKDLDFLQKIFSEDALIIVGNVIKVKPINKDLTNVNVPQEKVIYSKLKKTEYLTSLKENFKKNKYINIKFEEVEVAQHKKYTDYYGITVKQFYNSSNYNDIGYVFILIDFSNEELPLIHVRTWQPSIVDGKEFPRDQVFNIGSFGRLK